MTLIELHTSIIPRARNLYILFLYSQVEETINHFFFFFFLCQKYAHKTFEYSHVCAEIQSHLQEDNIINNIAAVTAPAVTFEDELDEKFREVVNGTVTEIRAQTGGTASLPCKLSDPGAGTVSIVYFYYSIFP